MSPAATQWAAQPLEVIGLAASIEPTQLRPRSSQQKSQA